MKRKTQYLLLIFLINTSYLIAQDAHYWTEQYGNRSMLLVGNVIGSVEDLGTVFYNPSRLASKQNSSFLISAKALQLVTIKVKEGVGKADLSNNRFGSAPTLIAGSFDLKKVKWLKKLHNHKFAYAFMSRYNYKYSLDARINTTYEFNGDWVGEENLYGSLDWTKSFSEEWLGLTWAIPLNDYWNIGITNFLTVISQSANYQYDLQALGETTSGDDQVAILTRNRFRSMNDFGYVAKMGISYAKKNVKLGLTATTPKAHIKGSGTLLYEELLAGYENSNHPESNNILESHFTENAKVKFKSPLSVGIGGAYSFGRNTLHVSAEWFNKVDKYFILIPESFIGQTSNEEILNRYVDERKSVINYGIGAEWGITDSLSFYTSFSTDFSSLVLNNTKDISKRVTDGFDNSFFTANIYNFGGGFDWILKKVRLTLGCVYSRGIQTMPQIVKFPEDTNNPDTNPDDIKYTDLVWERWRVLVGFSMPINKSNN